MNNSSVDERCISLTDVLFDDVVRRPFIPGDILDRLRLHFGINAVMYGEGRKVIVRSSFSGAPSLTKKARRYLFHLLNPNPDQLYDLHLSTEWVQLLTRNTSFLTAIEMEFSVVLFIQSGQFYNMKPTYNNAANLQLTSFKALLERTPCREQYGNVSIQDVNEFMRDRPSGNFFAFQEVPPEFAKAFYHFTCQLPTVDESSSMAMIIHGDLELSAHVQSLPIESLTCRLVNPYGNCRQIPSDIFYRTRYLHGQSFFLICLKPNSVSVAYNAVKTPTDAASMYFQRLLMWRHDTMIDIPMYWYQTFVEVPVFFYKLERFAGVEIIFDPDKHSICVQGDCREILLRHVFTDRYDQKDQKIDIEVADSLIESQKILSRNEIKVIPNAVRKRLAFFLQGFIETIFRIRDKSYWKFVNPQSDVVVDLSSSDDDEVQMVTSKSSDTSPNHNLLKGDNDALKKMTPSMKRKLLTKVEKALCLGFFVHDIIQVVIDKGAHRAALLSENNFMGHLCDKQLSGAQPSDAPKPLPLTEMELRFKECFCADYPITSSSENMSDSKVEERIQLLTDIITEALKKSTSNSRQNAPVSSQLNECVVEVVGASGNTAPTGIATRVIPTLPNNLNRNTKENQRSYSPNSNFGIGFGRGRPQALLPTPPGTDRSMGAPTTCGAHVVPVEQPSVFTQSSQVFKPNAASHAHAHDFRPIIIDGSNVSYEFSKHKWFDPTGMKAAVDRFLEMGCRQIFVLVPRKRMVEDRREIMANLEKEGYLSYTPSRKVWDERLGRVVTQTPYDDRIIVQSAVEHDGVIVSNDNFRDLKRENKEWESFIDQRLLMYCFVGERFFVSEDPFGPGEVSLMELLCRECGRQREMQRNFRPITNSRITPSVGPAVPPRTPEENSTIRSELLKILPNERSKIEMLLRTDTFTTDLNRLVEKLLS